MKVSSTRFGEIDIKETEIISLSNGLIGFEEETNFILLPSKNPLTGWLQSIKTPNLAFVVSNPYDFYSNYEFNLTDNDQKELNISKADDVTVLSILVVKSGAEEITANLLAPVIINKNNRCGKQIILNNSGYSTKHYVLNDIKKAAKNHSKELELTVSR